MLRRLLLASSLLAMTPAAAQQATAVEQARAAIERIRALNPRLNAVIAIDPTAMDHARALDRS